MALDQLRDTDTFKRLQSEVQTQMQSEQMTAEERSQAVLKFFNGITDGNN